MSYSRSYSRTVTQSYTKSVTVSYPKSESGGSKTVTVTGTVEVPVNIDILVDTNNFDSRVNGCKNSVNMLNGAVVATTAEEVIAKSKASKKIGKSVVKGFFDYISYEISQLKSELTAKCNSILMTLFEQKAACGDKSQQMQGDYERISTRYGKLFTDLDQELKTRIKAIDAPIFKANRDMMECTTRTVDTSLLGIATILAAETAQIDAILSASTIKNRAKELIGQANTFLAGAYSLQNTLRDMLVEDDGTKLFMLPIVYVESTETSNSVKRKVYGSSVPSLQKIANIDTNLEERFQSSNIEWSAITSSQSEQIDSHFNSELSASQVDSRIAKVMMELKEKNIINVVKNI